MWVSFITLSRSESGNESSILILVHVRARFRFKIRFRLGPGSGSGSYSGSVSEFNELEPRLKSAKNRFPLSTGLNLETLNTILSETNHF